MAVPGNDLLEPAAEADVALDEECGRPDFLAKLPPHWALGPVHLLLAVWFGGMFLLVNHFPLRGTDLWCHVLYGQWILEHHRLPEHDPFCPLAVAEPVVDSAWLSQVLFAGVEAAGGTEWLSHLFALTVLVTHLVLARVFYLRSRSATVALLGSIAVFVVGFSRLSTVRPENFGALGFALLLYLIVSAERGAADERPSADPPTRLPWRWWLGVCALMATWANLHGSFLCGLAVLGCWWLGTAIDAAWQGRSLRAALAGRQVRFRLATLLLAAAATLLNPYGLGLLWHNIAFSGNANVRDLLEWQPLTILGVGGREFACSWVVLLLALRHSRRRVPAWHALALAAFAVGAVCGVRMLGWYAAVFGVVLVPHLADILTRLAAARGQPEPAADCAAADGAAADGPVLPRGRSWRISLVCLLVIWIALVFSPLSASLLGRPGRDLPRLVGPTTPIALTRYLREHPPAGLILNPQWWGDWLVREGPPHLAPFATTNVHLLPPGVWRDYLRVSAAAPAWESVPDRYQVRTIVVDKAGQPFLAEEVRSSDRWQIVYEDPLGLVAVRQQK